MATNEVLIKGGTQYSFQSSVYVPTGNSDLTTVSPTVVDLTLDEGGTGLSAGAAVNSDQVDLGAARPEQFTVTAAIEFFAAILAGSLVSFYWSYSENSAVGVGNVGNPDGVDGPYAGDGGGDVAESVKQMQLIGAFVTTDLVGVQKAKVGTFSPLGRFGQLIVVNDTATLICGTDDSESSVLMVGQITEIQAAA